MSRPQLTCSMPSRKRRQPHVKLPDGPTNAKEIFDFVPWMVEVLKRHGSLARLLDVCSHGLWSTLAWIAHEKPCV